MRSKIKSTDSSTNTLGSLRKMTSKGKGKALGTRAGILRDWREASGRTAKHLGLPRDSMRDGR